MKIIIWNLRELFILAEIKYMNLSIVIIVSNIDTCFRLVSANFFHSHPRATRQRYSIKFISLFCVSTESTSVQLIYDFRTLARFVSFLILFSISATTFNKHLSSPFCIIYVMLHSREKRWEIIEESLEHRHD